jgi:monoamine oxidase
VKVATRRGTIEARTVVITVSTNVLAAESIDFVPALPDWKVSAAAAIPLGTANKVAFGIDGRHLGVDGHTNVAVPVAGDQMMSFQFRPFGYDMANGYLAGQLGRELEAAGEVEMIAAARDALKWVFGNDIAKHITTAACSRWGYEPSILGAYAAAKPGQADRRADLAEPIDNLLFFAGEATSPDFFSTCHGAPLSGIAAVNAASTVRSNR